MARRRWVAPLVVALVTFAVFLPALKAGFVSWDDDKNFLANHNYRGLGRAQLAWMWSTFHLGTWIPLSWMSLGLDYVLWGMNPAGYHFTNLVLHSANAALVFLLAWRVLQAAGTIRPDDGPVRSIVPAAVAALVFAIHPLRVESVAWITERRDVLSGFFYLASALAYLRATGNPEGHRWSYRSALALYACALLAKGTAVTLPAALLILNLYPLRRLGGEAGWWSTSARQVYRELTPFALMAGAVTLVVFLALQPVEQLSIAGKVAVSTYSLLFYSWKTLVPTWLSPLYAMPETIDPTQLVFVAGYGALIAAAVAAWIARRRWPGVSAGLLAFVVILFPLLGVHQGGPQIAADRNTYNASVALAVLFGGAVARASRARPRTTAVAITTILLTFAALTRRQVAVWHDSTALWTQVLRVEPGSALGHNNFGNLLVSDGRVGDAITHFRAAIAAKPGFADAHLNLGVALTRHGKTTEAIGEFRRALEIRPDLADAESDWGVALAQSGDLAGAVEHYARAVTIDPAHADAHVNWGNALVRMSRPEDGIAHYEDAVRFNPRHVDAELNWGVALALMGRAGEAAMHFERVLVLQPDHARAREYLSRVR